MASRNPDTGQWTDADVEYPPEPTRMLVFDGPMTQEQAGVIRSIYALIGELPPDVRRVIAADLARTHGGARSDGEA